MHQTLAQSYELCVPVGNVMQILKEVNRKRTEERTSWSFSNIKHEKANFPRLEFMMEESSR